MTHVRRPIHLQLRLPPTGGAIISSQSTGTVGTGSVGVGGGTRCSPKSTSSAPLTPNRDLLPSQIMPNLFVGNLEQTSRETVNRLNISYILSLGLLPLISSSGCSPSSPSKSSTTTSATSGSPAPITPSNTQSTANNNNNNNSSNHQHHHSHQLYDNKNPQIILPTQNSSKDFKIRIRSLMSHDSTLTPTPTNGVTNSSKLRMSSSGSLEQRDENKGINNKIFRTIHCKCINIADNNEQILEKFFDEAHQFIDEARRRKCNVLVHCLAGVSRSPTIAIAYLMRCNSLRLQDAYNFVKRCRPQIDPNLSFMGQLMIYEKNLEDDGSKNKVLSL